MIGYMEIEIKHISNFFMVLTSEYNLSSGNSYLSFYITT